MNYLTDEFITTKHQSPLQKIKDFFSDPDDLRVMFSCFLADLLVTLFLFYSFGLIF